MESAGKFFESYIHGCRKKIESQIIDYLPYLSTRQKELVLSFVKSFAREDSDWRSEEGFSADMLNRIKQPEKGEVAF
jgi:hypothetical protein